MSVLQRPDHRRLVQHPATRCVHDDAPALHRPDLALPDQTARLLAQRHVHAQHVRPCTKRVHALNVLAPLWYVGPTAPTVVQHAHGKGVYKVREGEADPTEPEDAEGARGQIVRVPGGDGLVPGAGVEGSFGF